MAIIQRMMPTRFLQDLPIGELISGLLVFFIAVFLLSGCGSMAGPKADMQFAATCLDEKLWNEAIMRYNRVLEQDPENVAAYNNLGIAYEALGKFDEALESYKNALRIDPENKYVKRNLDALLRTKRVSVDA